MVFAILFQNKKVDRHVRDGDTGTYLGELVNNVGWKKRQEIGGSYI